MPAVNPCKDVYWTLKWAQLDWTTDWANNEAFRSVGGETCAWPRNGGDTHLATPPPRPPPALHPCPIHSHQSVQMSFGFPCLELIYLVEHEVGAGTGVGRQACETFAGIAQIGGMVEEGEC